VRSSVTETAAEGHASQPWASATTGFVWSRADAREWARPVPSRRQSTPTARRVCDSVDVTVEADPNDYQRLDPDLVVQTLQRLQHRIVSRFPDRGLSKVAGQLATMADQIARSVDSSRNRLHRTRRVARALSVLVVLVAVIVLALALGDALTNGPDRSFEWLPLIESTINDIVFAAIAVFFPETNCRTGSSVAGSCRSCTACVRWPTSSTCISSPRLPSGSDRTRNP
jgi:hypothetical protein